MRDQLDPRRSHLVQVLYLYTQALELSDLETITRIMRKAEQDSALERMLLEINEVYQEVDTPSISSRDIEYLQDFLLPFIKQEVHTQVNDNTIRREQKLVRTPEQPHKQESGQGLMKDAITTTTSTERQPLPGESQHPVYRFVRKRRLAHFVQMLAAVLVVGLLLSGFLLLLSGRHPISSGPSTGGTSNVTSMVAVSSSGGTVYGLRAWDGAILWQYATGIVDHSVGSDSSLAVLNNRVYFVVRGRVFALRGSDGTLLWHQDVLPASAHVFGSTTYNFALDGNILLVRLANNGGNTSVLFALNASSGSLLWHYNMNIQYVIAASQGIAYVGSSNADGSNQTLRALRSADGKELWSYNTGQRYMTDPITVLVVGDVLYLQGNVYDEPVTNNTRVFQSLTALNATTGKLLWSKPLHIDPLSDSQSNQGLLLSANNEVILYSGYHFCAYSSSDGSQLWCSHDFAQRPPDVNSNTIINANIPDFYAVAGQTLATIGLSFGNNFHMKVETLSLKTGKTLWTRNLNFTTSSGIGVGVMGVLIRGDAHAVYALVGNDVYALNSDNGYILWHNVSGIKGITGLAVG